MMRDDEKKKHRGRMRLMRWRLDGEEDCDGAVQVSWRHEAMGAGLKAGKGERETKAMMVMVMMRMVAVVTGDIAVFHIVSVVDPPPARGAEARDDDDMIRLLQQSLRASPLRCWRTVCLVCRLIQLVCSANSAVSRPNWRACRKLRRRRLWHRFARPASHQPSW